MGLTIANNVTSLNAQNNLTRANSRLTKSVERLSSGLKINRGADGPAALVISEKQRAQISGLKQAIENTEKAVSLVQTAEGALGEINSLLLKVRTLAIDSANTGINDEDALAANQSEINNALDTIDRIANNTQFLTKKLLDGSAGINGVPNDTDVTFLQATNDTSAGSYAVAISAAAEKATITNGTAQSSALAGAENLTINGVAISLNAGLTQSQVVDRINEFTSQTGVTAEDVAGNTRLSSANFGTNASISVVSDVAAAADSSGFGNSVSTDSGVDIAGTIDGVAASGSGNVLSATSGAAQGLKIQVGTDPSNATQTVSGAQGAVSVSVNSLTFQIGANANQTANIAIGRVNPSSLGVGVNGNQFGNLSEVDVTTGAGAQDALAVVDAAIDDITNLRGDLGAFQQNTLNATANNLRATLENTVNAESVIRDTDFAEEIANFTQQQVLVQAGTAVLGNANQLPQLVLSLLG
ncbi:flagellin [Thalassoglobus sp. JC818]|uniref:flagellin N-terminal helical domain-containing protein n=1 Tax=Thalassoglobus sp. JC818 TaxID=3232136 RepID=UPI0034597728